MEFFYQIKGKKAPDQEVGAFGGNWVFPPIFSGKVTAISKKHAQLKIEEEYGRKFPLRVLSTDLDSHEFLLSIEEIKPGSHLERLFELQTCKHCSNTFYVIDKYNDHNDNYKGSEYCSQECKTNAYQVGVYLRNQSQVLNGTANPIIYKIYNRVTNLTYIGKTTQVFTLRWYQHFFQGGDCAFHKAIGQSPVTDWTFEVVEIVKIPEDVKTTAEVEKIISQRERFWINHFDSKNNGYNSI